MSYEINELDKGLIKSWTIGVPFDKNAFEQVANVASLPFIFKHVAVMPDVHWGMGSTIGSVIATKGAIIPAAVGVDIGCGMIAALTSLTANDLPDNLKSLRFDIEANIPHGRTNNGQTGDKGAWGDVPYEISRYWATNLKDRFESICYKHPKIEKTNNRCHLGTLGTGNHFIEICLDEQDRVWVMLHSGSRGVGNRIGMYFIEKAKKDMERYFIQLPDNNLSYLVEGSENYQDYVEAVYWAQDFAKLNRQIMMDAVLASLMQIKEFTVFGDVVSCHHNYIAVENHFGSNVIITRKGAVRARVGDVGIIPGSMGEKSYIVEGLGEKESFNSCSHGAGRVMGRKEAFRQVTLEQHLEAIKGVECDQGEDKIDETPKAYKDIDAVMAAQDDLVKVLHTLKQVVCVKG